MPLLPALVSSGSEAVGDDMMAVPPAPGAVDATNVGANDLQPAIRKFMLPAAVKPTLPPASACIVGAAASVGSESPVAVVPRTRRGADHLVEKLANHLGTGEVNDDAVDAMAGGSVPVSACRHLQRFVGCETPHCSVRELQLIRVCARVCVLLACLLVCVADDAAASYQRRLI